jgi:hypothetical protein
MQNKTAGDTLYHVQFLNLIESESCICVEQSKTEATQSQNIFIVTNWESGFLAIDWFFQNRVW